MHPREFDLRYTLCFCRTEGKILLLHRRFPPNMNRWNGIGGKIEHGETPEEGLYREVQEEAGIDLRQACDVHFGGIVTWSGATAPGNDRKGMYVYLADVPGSCLWKIPREIPEGILEWKTVSWACNAESESIVDNLPRFLPNTLQKRSPRHYHCTYDQGTLKAFDERNFVCREHPMLSKNTV